MNARTRLRPGAEMDGRLMRGPAAKTGRNLPGWASRGFTEQQKEALETDIQLAASDFRRVNNRGMAPWETKVMLNEMLCRYYFNAAPSDLMLGEIQYGPYRGRKIARGKDGQSGARILLSDRSGNPMGVEINLAAGGDTKMGNASGDQAIVRSFADTATYGGTTGVVPPPMWDRQLVKTSRGNVWQPLCAMGIAPDLQWTGPLFNTTIEEKLFTSASAYRTLEAAILPREEGKSGYQVRPTVIDANWTVRGYMWHATLTLEMLRSRANQVLGMDVKIRDFMGQAPNMVDGYDTIMGLFWGLELGMTRRYDATGNAWVTTAAAPWGAAEFITTNAYLHQAYFDYVNGIFYEPHKGSNYRKYNSATLVNDGIFKTSGNKIFELLLYMNMMMSRKKKNLEVAFLPNDLLLLHVQDERAWNQLFTGTPSVRFSNQPGYKGSIRLMGAANEVQIIGYDIGHMPVFATTDTSPVNIDYLAIGCEEGQVMTDMPWLPPTFFVGEESEVVSVDGQNVTRMTGRDVLSLLHIGCVEPLDLTSAVMVKCMKTAHAQA